MLDRREEKPLSLLYNGTAKTEVRENNSQDITRGREAVLPRTLETPKENPGQKRQYHPKDCAVEGDGRISTEHHSQLARKSQTSSPISSKPPPKIVDNKKLKWDPQVWRRAPEILTRGQGVGRHTL